jgi:hypothetical protein
MRARAKNCLRRSACSQHQNAGRTSDPPVLPHRSRMVSFKPHGRGQRTRMIRLLNEPFFLPEPLLPTLSFLGQTDERTVKPLAQYPVAAWLHAYAGAAS